MEPLVKVFSTTDALTAEIICNALNEEGISAHLANEHQAGLTGILDVSIHVPKSQLDSARNFIAKHGEGQT